MDHCAGFELLNGMIKTQISRLVPTQSRLETSVPGLAIMRYDAETSPERCLCSPMVAYVVQGFKRAFYGERESNYGEGQCVVLGIDMPGTFQIMDASPATPFLSLSVKLDNRIIFNLFSEIPALAAATSDSSSPVGVIHVSFELLDAFRRLVNLLEYPENIPLFGNAIMREIHFHILSGNLGSQLRLFNTFGTKAYQIGGAISWLRANYKSALKIGDMAARANMALSTFNRYFRQVTGLSPLQFQKHLRLYEAERLMLVKTRMPLRPLWLLVMKAAPSSPENTKGFSELLPARTWSEEKPDNPGHDRNIQAPCCSGRLFSMSESGKHRGEMCIVINNKFP